MSNFVYFIIRPSTNSIKIGFSVDPNRRLAELQTGSDERLELLTFIEATAHVEKEIHRHLMNSRMIGEWFQCTDEVLRLIDRVRAILREDARLAVQHADAFEAWADRRFGRAA